MVGAAGDPIINSSFLNRAWSHNSVLRSSCPDLSSLICTILFKDGGNVISDKFVNPDRERLQMVLEREMVSI